MLFSNLSVNQEYLLKIQALTASLYQENLIYPGVISEVNISYDILYTILYFLRLILQELFLTNTRAIH